MALVARHPAGHVLVVVHKGIIKRGVGHLLGMSSEAVARLDPALGSLSVVSCGASKELRHWRPHPRGVGRWRVLSVFSTPNRPDCVSCGVPPQALPHGTRGYPDERPHRPDPHRIVVRPDARGGRPRLRSPRSRTSRTSSRTGPSPGSPSPLRCPRAPPPSSSPPASVGLAGARHVTDRLLTIQAPDDAATLVWTAASWARPAPSRRDGTRSPAALVAPEGHRPVLHAASPRRPQGPRSRAQPRGHDARTPRHSGTRPARPWAHVLRGGTQGPAPRASSSQPGSTSPRC